MTRPDATTKCPGFAWVGQPFTSCDNCGEPYWDHQHVMTIRAGARPFDALIPTPITDAEAVRAAWGSTDDAN